MLDQMFTAENFRRIYDAENRKGADLATRYFPTLEPFTLSIRNKVQEIRDLRKSESTFKASDFEARLLTLKAELTALKVVKSSAVDALMDEISHKVLKPSFKIDLSQKMGPKGKAVFCIDEEPETFLPLSRSSVTFIAFMASNKRAVTTLYVSFAICSAVNFLLNWFARIFLHFMRVSIVSVC
ncbi:hypothetical protein L1889_07345 [Paenalcaligenes niemegkensis]|nr:hypothetical protein [Paenalcaligenes niemegkensis]